MKRYSLSDLESCDMISNLINSNNPFSITRIGLGGESIVTAFTLHNMDINKDYLNWFYINAGFYGTDNYKIYSELYKEACDTSDLHAYIGDNMFLDIENFLVPENKTCISLSSIESFRFPQDYNWFDKLSNKKVLIISPFYNSITHQLERIDKVWSNGFIKNADNIKVYKSYQTIGGIGPHKDWYESFDIMCDDISKIDFDVALLGCGSYGLPLVNFIKNKLNKSAIYVGGGLQLYFGILGKRWEQDVFIKDNINEYWIRPFPEDTPTYSHLVEGGCYW